MKREELIETLTNNAEVHRDEASKANLRLQLRSAKVAKLEEQNKLLEETIKNMRTMHNHFVDGVIAFVEKLDKSSILSSYKTTIESLPKAQWEEPKTEN